VFLSGLALAARAQDAYYLTLGGEGTASVIVSQGDATAYIVDGGKKKTGLPQAGIEDGKKVLDSLHDMGIKRLAVIGSHPHRDHLGGLVALIQDEEKLSRFDTLLFVDSGYDGTKLIDVFNKAYQNWMPGKTVRHIDVSRQKQAFADFAGENA